MIKNVQALRAFAALLVVFPHLGHALGALGLPLFGYGGVDLFFVISGFVMVHTTRRNPTRPSVFIRKRIARIVPAYWLMTALVFFVALRWPRAVQATEADPMQLAKSLIFIPSMKANGAIHPVLYVGWTLNYEMFFYALFAAALFVPAYTLGLAAVIGALVSLVALGRACGAHGTIAVFYSRPIVLEFAFGMLVAVAVERLPTETTAVAKWIALAALIGGLVVILGARVVWSEDSRVVTSGVPAAVAVAGAVALERWGWSARSPAVIALGDASYMIYLANPFVAQTAQRVGEAQVVGRGWAVAVVGVTLVGAAVVGIAMHRWIERPLSLGARRLLLLRVERC
jgi:exopolysaccharide production protein ExoZ